MVTLATPVREQLGRLGFPTDTLGAQLGELSPARLRQLGAADFGPDIRENRFFSGSRDGRIEMAKAFSNRTPSAAKQALEGFVGSTYASERFGLHPSSSDPLPHLLSRRTSRPALMTIAVARRPELRERVGVAVGAQIASDGRTDGVLSVQRARPATRSPAPAGGPTPSFGTGTIWEIMMAMDQAILHEAARLGLGQGSGIAGTVGAMEAMGLWSLTPDEGDASEWRGFGLSSRGGSAQGMNPGVPQPAAGPENDNSGLDVEIMRVKRMIDKKTQMMELYSQTLSKYNSSANSIIGNMKA